MRTVALVCQSSSWASHGVARGSRQGMAAWQLTIHRSVYAHAPQITRRRPRKRPSPSRGRSDSNTSIST